MEQTHQRATLRLLRTPEPADPQPTVGFCSHCGARPEGESESRVCGSCSLGLILQAASDAAPEPGDAFIVIDGSLSVCAVSNAAESLLAARETDAVNRHVTELLVPAEAEAETETGDRHNLAVAITWAARGDQGTRTVHLRPANTFGVRLRGRISSCGPPRAALIVFD